MKVIILGTGAGTMPPSRYKSCFYISLDKKNNLILDTGGGTEIISQFNKAKLDPVSANHIFISHLHFDHSFGLTPLLYYQAVDRKNDRPPKTFVYANNKVIQELKKITKIFGAGLLERWDKDLKWVTLRHEKPAEITSNVGLTAFPAKGRKSLKEKDSSCLVEFLDSNKKVLYSGDTSPNKNLTKYAKKANLIIHEATLTCDKEEHAHKHGHSTAKDAAILAEKSKAKQLVLTHIYKENMAKKLLEEAKRYFSGPVLVAKDFQTIIF